MNCKPWFLAKQRLLSVALSLLVLFFSALSHAQITPSADSYTNTADPTTNYGAATLLYVNGAKGISYLQFNLASIPATANISQATLKLYVNGVATAGSFNVDYVNAAWLESTIDASNAPPLGGNIASGINVTTADKNQYILINLTSAVQAWLNGSETNNGIALVANSTFNASFDAKENTTTSHAPELDVAYADGEGTITGVTTASGSGLTGGGTSGTLNLGLTNTCAANQVLQWNGSAWACATAGTGTITGVTAGTDLTGGGSSGTLTLSLDTTKVPLLASNNAFTGNNSFTSSTTGGTGVFANAGSSTASNGVIAYGATGVAGYATVANSIALYGNAGSSNGSAGIYGTGGTYGVYGTSNYGTGPYYYGVYGTTNYGTGGGFGVYGTTNSGYGVFGTVPSSGIDGVHGESSSQNSGVAGLNFNSTYGYGVYGWATNGYGVYGTGLSTGFDAVRGEAYSEWAGVAGLNHSTGGYGVYGLAQGLEGYGGGFFNSLGGWAGYFQGNVDVVGSLSKSSGSFKIDHPLDPANKYLYHSFVESPDMKNIYDGVATLDASGEAIVEMPDWFGVLNRDFRYQLTCIGGFAPVYIAEELANNQFKIGGGRSGMRVSWQITGIRQDPWANAHRIPVEQEKEDKLKGYYLHPELYGAPEEKQIEWARHPAMMKKMREDGDKTAQKQARMTELAASAHDTK